MSNTPKTFPNKSENSKPLFGIIKCNTSNKIDKKNRYINIKFNLFFSYDK